MKMSKPDKAIPFRDGYCGQKIKAGSKPQRRTDVEEWDGCHDSIPWPPKPKRAWTYSGDLRTWPAGWIEPVKKKRKVNK